MSFEVLFDRSMMFSCVQEPLGGAHSDPVQTSKNIKTVIMKYMNVSALSLIMWDNWTSLLRPAQCTVSGIIVSCGQTTS